MSLYQIGSALVQGLKATTWGAKVPTEFKSNPDGSMTPVEGGDTIDTGVQAAITALVNRLQSQSPIDLSGAVEFNQSGNSPAIRIYVDTSIVGTNYNSLIQFVDVANNTVTNIGTNGISNTTLNNNSNSTNVTNVNDITNITQITNNGSNPAGFTGSVTVVTGVSGNVSVSGCTATLSLNLTTSVITFQNGLCVGAG